MRADLRRVPEYIEPRPGESAQIERHDGRWQQRGKMAPHDAISTRGDTRPRLRCHIFEQRPQALARLPGEDVFDRYSIRNDTIGWQHQTSSHGVNAAY